MPHPRDLVELDLDPGRPRPLREGHGVVAQELGAAGLDEQGRQPLQVRAGGGDRGVVGRRVAGVEPRGQRQRLAPQDRLAVVAAGAPPRGAGAEVEPGAQERRAERERGARVAQAQQQRDGQPAAGRLAAERDPGGQALLLQPRVGAPRASSSAAGCGCSGARR